MDKLKMQSRNAVESNVKKIAALFPQCVTEAAEKITLPDGSFKYESRLVVDFDKLRDELSKEVVEGAEERYQFTWPDKRAASRLANEPTDKTLRPDIKSSVDFWNTENIYIEGDNLDVLKVLRENYLGKVKMIYIDPPYNTGNDFVYNDDFTQGKDKFEETSGLFDEDGNQTIDPMQRNTESNGRFHTDWLNMIYPRLKVVRDLLTEEGVIFISLDDNEIDNLKKLCNEIFGSENFLGQITVVGNPRGRDYGGIARMHDYILAYSKSKATSLNLIRDVDSSFPMEDALGGFELRELRNRNIKFNKENRPNLYYPFYIDTTSADTNGLYPISLEKTERFQYELYPLESQGINTVWRWGKQKSQENININIAAKPMKNGSYMIVEKYREARRMARSVWWDKDSNTEKGTLLVKSLFNGKVFDYPKPVELISRLLEMGSSEDSLVLDFFSGSATTAHAVMKLNAEDGGHRKFIMVQLPEVTDEKSEARKEGYKTICQIGEERIRRAGKKVKEEAGEKAKDLDTGFRVLKLDSSNMEDVFYRPEDFSEQDLFNSVDNIKPDRTPLDLLFQVLPELNIELSAKIEEKEVNGKKVFFVDGNYLIATFDKEVNESTVTEIAKMKPQYFVMRDASAANDNVLDNFEQIFKHYSPDTTRKIL